MILDFASRIAGVASCTGLIVLASIGAAGAEPARIYAKKAAYDDVRFELNNAIIGRGFVIDYTGHIDRMLERTGADVGSSKPIYKSAEFFTFCSAKLSRLAMEADPGNIGVCPYVVFVYESAAKPGEVTVGYRRPAAAAAGAAAVAEIDSLLDSIVQAAIK